MQFSSKKNLLNVCTVSNKSTASAKMSTNANKASTTVPHFKFAGTTSALFIVWVMPILFLDALMSTVAEDSSVLPTQIDKARVTELILLVF